MSLKQDITSKVKEILETSLDVKEVTYVPEITDTYLTFNNGGLKFDTTVLFIDMRDSTIVLNNHNKPTIAKIHKAYLHTTVKIAKSLGGEVRSFNGDSVLAFFQGTTQRTLSNAVEAAMKISYMLSSSESGINNLLAKYSAVDFGIGLDYGKVLCTKVGIGGDNNTKDLIWIGNPINKSVVISDDRKSPNHIGISQIVYNNLEDCVKYHVKKDGWGNDVKIDMWTQRYIAYNGKSEICYSSNYYWTVE